MPTLKAAIDALPVHQLRDLGQYIEQRIALLNDTAVLRDIVADQRVNPQTAELLPGRGVVMSHTGMAIAELIQEEKAAERRQAAARREAQR